MNANCLDDSGHPLVLQSWPYLPPAESFCPEHADCSVNMGTTWNKEDLLGIRIVGDHQVKAWAAEMSLSEKRDLLSAVPKSNVSPNVPETHRLSENEVVIREPDRFFSSCPSISKLSVSTFPTCYK
ncbi:hypothetical protein B0H19DRAFT_1227012, partial [Mycena capillaripes]